MVTRRDSISLMAASAVALIVRSGARAADIPHPLTADFADPMFAEPFVDIDEWHDVPARHRYVHGGFRGTEALFSIYFPPKEQYQRRFIQPVWAASGNENAAKLGTPMIEGPIPTPENTAIGFAFSNGAYLVESNLGAKDMYSLPDHTIEGYRASAAVAQYSRILAAQMYGPHRPYGYCYGGSGGGFKTISMMESTTGIWDGGCPYVIGSPMHIPYGLCVSAYGFRVLKEKMPDIVDALDAGGSGDPYAGLNAEEHAALLEMMRFGIPPGILFCYERLGYGPLASLIDYMVKWDPTYFDDFWKLPGYLGANPPASLQRARIQHQTKIAKVLTLDEARVRGLSVLPNSSGKYIEPVAFQLAEAPKGDLLGASLIIESGAAAGQRMSVRGAKGDTVALGIGPDAYQLAGSIKDGDQIMIDNSIYLAAQCYQRHQVPSKEYHAWDQYRDANGKPLYPQRNVPLMGPRLAEQGAGSIQSGKFNGKMIVVEAMTDEYAYPWAADWYHTKVKDNFGPRTDESFRVWFAEKSMHGGGTRYLKQDGVRIAGYEGILQQALRDVVAWVEKGTPPPASTSYKVADSQIVVAPTASQRKSVQPVVKLTVNGGARADVKVGESVILVGLVEVPPGAGKVVIADWDLEGTGDYPLKGQLQPSDASGYHVSVKTIHAFPKTGTYFPALRAGSQRNPDGTVYACAVNLDRVRVVVS